MEYISDNSLGVNSVSWAPYTAYMAEDQSSDPSSQPTHPLRLVTGGCDNRIRFWIKSASTGQWEADPAPLGTEVAHTDWVRDVAWAPSVIPGTNIVASCSEDRTVIVWTQKGGSEGTWEPLLLHTFEEPVWRLSWSVTGNILAVSSGDSSVTLWKQGLDMTWSQVSTVEDVSGSGNDSQQQ